MTIKIPRKGYFKIIKNYFKQISNKDNLPIALFVMLFIVTGILIVYKDGSNSNYPHGGPSAFASELIKLAQVGPDDEGNDEEQISAKCSLTGVNEASFFPPNYGKADTFNMGFVEAIVNNPADIDPAKICEWSSKGVKTIIRPCVGSGDGDDGYCEIFNIGSDTNKAFLKKLSEIKCEFYVTGVNEAPRELRNKTGYNMTEVAKITNDFSNSLLAAKALNSNLKVLTTVVDPTYNDKNPFSGTTYTFHDFASRLGFNKAYTDKFDGIAVNLYNVDGKKAYDYYNAFLADYGLSGSNIYVTEFGKLEQRADRGNVPPADAINNMKLAYTVLVANAKAVLFFNGFGTNPDKNFEYGNLLDDQDGNGEADIYQVIGKECGFDVDSVPQLATGDVECCNWTDDFSLASCKTTTNYSNGNRSSGGDSLSSGVRMIRQPDGKWIVKYAITQQVHNFPLLRYLAATDIEGTQLHPFTSDPGSDSLLNASISGADFTNQFEGLAKFELADGSSYFIPVPSFGTATASLQYWRDDYYDPNNLHCGLFIDQDQNEAHGEAPSDSKVLAISVIEPDPGNIFRKKWGRPITDLSGFGLATRTVDEMKILSGYATDEEANDTATQLIGTNFNYNDFMAACENACGGESIIPISKCLQADSYVFAQSRNERLVPEESEIGGKAFTPDEMCKMMYEKDDIISGTCVLRGPNGTQVNLPHTSKNSPFPVDLPQLPPGATYKDYYNYLRGQGYTGFNITGTPQYKIEIPETKELKLEGLGKALEQKYEEERQAAIKTFDMKVCHYENLGVNIATTRTLYDGSPGTSKVADRRPRFENLVGQSNLLFNGLDRPGEQDFTYSMLDFDSPENAVCKKTSGELYNSTALAPQGWGIAGNSGSLLSQQLGYVPNSQATTTFVYPWVGQIPKINERMTFWSKDVLYSEYSPTRENLKNIYLKPDAQKTEAEKVLIPFCDDVSAEDRLDGNENGRPTIDCLCDIRTEDPLQMYLMKEGYLQTGKTFVNDFDQCKTSYDPGPSPDIPEEESNCDLGTIADGIMQPMNIPNDDYIGTKCGGSVGTVNFHPGIDMSRGSGSNIHAAEDGEVILVYNAIPENTVFREAPERGYYNSYPLWGEYGNFVAIKHKDGVSIYAHMQQNTEVQKGQCVKKGDLVGHQDNTGNVYGSHLHFEVRTPTANDYEQPSTTYCFDKYTTAAADKNLIVPLEPFSPTGDTGSSGGGNIPSPTTQLDCKPTDNDNGGYGEDYEPGPGSFENFDCLLKEVSNVINDELGGDYIPANLLFALTYQETKHRCSRDQCHWHSGKWYPNPQTNTYRVDYGQPTNCTATFSIDQRYSVNTSVGNIDRFNDMCSGDPNQTALIDTQILDFKGRGIGQFMPGTFRGYLERPEFQRCVERLGVDFTKGLERQEDPRSNYVPGRGQDTYTYTDFEAQRGLEKYSRSRNGDTLCAIAVKVYDAVGKKPYRSWDESNTTNSTDPAQLDDLNQIFRNYSGRGPADGYHTRARNYYNIGREYLNNLNCEPTTTPTPTP